MEEYFRATITGVFDCILSWKKQRQEETLDKILDLGDLLVDNRIYLRDYAHSGLRNYDIEADLSKKWKHLAARFAADFPEMSQLCENKSDYWIHPDLYSEKKVIELGITIRQLQHQYQITTKRLK